MTKHNLRKKGKKILKLFSPISNKKVKTLCQKYIHQEFIYFKILFYFLYLVFSPKFPATNHTLKALTNALIAGIRLTPLQQQNVRIQFLRTESNIPMKYKDHCSIRSHRTITFHHFLHM